MQIGDGKYKQLTYEDKGATISWGEDLGENRMKRLSEGEIFTLLNTDGTPYSRIVLDSFGRLREYVFERAAKLNEDLSNAEAE